ncbi:hypothetical protein CRENBAI_009168 [Crenichthys baileyi]|uniref:Uncharacterized protein n=1 Tax=Crenichthys baileyi TaxID=28760 RepID=A0AAV9SLS2_9TELE
MAAMSGSLMERVEGGVREPVTRLTPIATPVHQDPPREEGTFTPGLMAAAPWSPMEPKARDRHLAPRTGDRFSGLGLGTGTNAPTLPEQPRSLNKSRHLACRMNKLPGPNKEEPAESTPWCPVERPLSNKRANHPAQSKTRNKNTLHT